MTVSLLVDNDIVIKLARMDVYPEAIASIGVSTSGGIGSIGVMLRYMGRASEERRMRLVATRQEAERLNAVLQTIHEIELTEEEASLAAQLMKKVLQSGLDIQEGELLLIVVAVTRGAMDIATGDKRALQSLPGLEAQWPDLSMLRGRFLCLEQIFKMLCARHGLARVRQALATSPGTDAAVKFVFDQTAAHGAERLMAGLEFLVEQQIRKSAPGWVKSSS